MLIHGKIPVVIFTSPRCVPPIIYHTHVLIFNENLTLYRT